MESINTFSQGQNSDQSKTILNKETYLQALNFRNLGELGSSNGSLVNIKGNECKITFPDLQPIFKLILVEGSDTTDTSNIITFTINGVTSGNFTLSNTTTGFDIYSFIVNSFTGCYQNSTATTKTFAVAYEDNYVVLYNQPVYQDCSTVASIPTSITVTQTTTDGTKALLYFVNAGVGNPGNTLTQNTSYPYVKGTTSSNIIPIGSTFILNDIYILTAPNDLTYGPAGAIGELPPNDELKFAGAIWKLNIDDTTKQHTLTLVYSNNLDFTKYHPIPPSAITGRYESREIQRIYWSDNYNKIRTLNVAIPQLMAVSPNILSVIPRIEMTQAVLSAIADSGGTNMPTGCYQLGYRLSKILGSTTNFSELSNVVNLVLNNESTAFKDFEGEIGVTSKTITWSLSDLDTTFDQIEFIIAYKSDDGVVPTITSTGLQTLTKDMTFTYANPATTTYSQLTLDEFLLFSGTFTHAKTCDTKDNRLFWGNVRAPRKEIESFDTRAFRANDAGEIRLTNDNVNTIFADVNAASALPQTADAINEYYDINGDYSINACYLKPSTVGTTNILGGEGLNISYEFGTEIFELDHDAAIDNGNDDWDLYLSHAGSPYRTTSTGATSPSDMYYTYPQGGSYQPMVSSQRTSLLKGFQHEEIYRFGLQTFDKQGNPYFTKWIGDIKMPCYGDYNNNPGYSGINDFRLSIYGPSNDLFGQILYIKFTVDVSDIQDIIGGYQIVRVKRKDADRTIWGTGMINPLISKNDDPTGANFSIPANLAGTSTTNWLAPCFPVGSPIPYYDPLLTQEAIETLNVDIDDHFHQNFSKYKTFDSWDIDAGLRPAFTQGDKIRVRSKMRSVNYQNGAGGYRQYFFDGDLNYDSGGTRVPGTTSSMYNAGAGPAFTGFSTNDNLQQPYFLMKMVDSGTLYGTYQDFLPSTSEYDYSLGLNPVYVLGNESVAYGGKTFDNFGWSVGTGGLSVDSKTCGGKQTLLLHVADNDAGTAPFLYTSNNGGPGPDYNCVDTIKPFGKLLALYYKPNNNLYGGPTYINRSNNEYIPCGEYIPTTYNSIIIPQNVVSNYKTFGGDVFTTCYDFQKTFKLPGNEGASYGIYRYDSNNVFQPGNALLGFVNVAKAQFSTSFFFPTTNVYNSELRLAYHPNRNIFSTASYNGEDSYLYRTYNSASNDVKTYFPKPLNFQTSDEWINRIYWSEIKFNSETQDSWAEYLTSNFYDVEGNYGGINALVSLKENMYYLQERGVGSLMINPVSLINDSLGQSVKLGGSAPGSDVIQKHYYKAIDAGTFHQWSVYRSQSAITFVDARHKKIYLFDGETVTPISDLKGQRNFVIKRLHNELLKYDNPVINKGIITTYDYYHNEFLYTFNNTKQLTTDPITYDTTNDENLTLAYSELLNAFTGLYSFTPNLYINSNKYLISTKNSSVAPYYPSNKLWFHNYGAYGSFYGTIYPSTLKLLVNDNPLNTKVFDNMTIMSEAINDNVEWNDDLNIYPGSPTNPLYPDDINIKDSTFQQVRCYNQYQNTDWTTLTIAPLNNNIRKVEQGFNIQLPRNKFDYDTYNPSTYSIFDPSKLTKTTFGERLRDKWLITDFKYDNLAGLRFIIHNIKTLLRISDR